MDSCSLYTADKRGCKKLTPRYGIIDKLLVTNIQSEFL